MRSLSRILFALMGAAFGAVLVSFAEARDAAALAGLHDGATRLALADVGVIAPLAFLLGMAVALASLFLEPTGPVSPSERIAELRSEPVLARSRTAAIAPLAVLVAAAWVIGTAQAGRILLAEGSPATAGAALAATSVAWLLALGALALAAVPPARRALASAADRWPRALDPVTTGGIATVLVALLFVAGIRSGGAGGEGEGVLAIFGVLKRTELDLRPLVDVGAIAACAWIAPLALAGRSARPLAVVIGLLLLGAPLALTCRAAVGLERDPSLARAMERYAPLGRIALAVVRKATDRDHDGASPFFGGGDCNDRDPGVSPFAVDVPGNGVDEDCSGSDAVRAAAEPAAALPGAAPVVDRDCNLIFITVDTVRASDVSFLGYDKATTPHLDAVARDAIVYERAYALASYTGKALAPMLIGKYPSETLRDGSHFNRYFQGNTFLAERLRSAGVYTMGAASHWYFTPTWGVTQGFDRFDTSAVPASGQGDTDTSSTSPALTDAAIKMLGDNGGRRFFLWVHYFDPHAQYMPHDGAPDFSDPAAIGGRKRGLYDGEIWYVDHAIGRLLDYVEAQPWAKDTIVAMTSDHGEAMGEHGIDFQHGHELWEPLVRVPLLFRVPGVAPRHVPVKRSVIDVVPTLLDLMRVPQPPAGELSGRSLVTDFVSTGPAKRTSTYEERDVYIDMPDGPFTHLRRALIHGPTPGMKLVHLGGRQYQLYDLATDGDEREDLAGDPSRLEPMIEALAAKRANLHEIYVKPDAQ
ncbi:MAG: sulfatase [Polyangiaceae bacterium]